MNTEQVRKFKWFWAWQDEREEAWLAEMDREGLHLDSISFPGIYQFRKGTPGNWVYRLDFQSLKARDRVSYLQLFEDSGWEHVGDMGGWVYFRHKVNGTEIPEIYSDLESKLGKYQRVMIYLIIFLPIMIIIIPRADKIARYGPFFIILEILNLAIFLLYTYAMIQLIRRISQLKNRGKM